MREGRVKSAYRMLLIIAGIVVVLPALAQRTFDTDILAETFGYDENTKRSVALEDLHQGCERRDCIPSIDDPKFVSADEASHIADDDLVLALSLNGYHRAYPTRILDVHEIVNDFVAGIPLAVTWCPLCGSAVAVQRDFDDVVTEFGVSGLLYNSDLILYDRRTETLWDQVEATGIVGPLTGEKLVLTPVTLTRWARWKKAHPDTIVLSEDTGFPFDYSKDAYARYRNSRQLMFPVSKNDDSLHPKTVVFGFDIDGSKVAVTESKLEAEPEYDYMLAGETYRITLHDDGSVWMANTANSNETYSPTRLFWFAWFTFHPGTELIK